MLAVIPACGAHSFSIMQLLLLRHVDKTQARGTHVYAQTYDLFRLSRRTSLTIAGAVSVKSHEAPENIPIRSSFSYLVLIQYVYASALPFTLNQ